MSGTSGLALLLRFVLSMGAVLALVLLCAHLFRRSRSWTGHRRTAAPLEVVARQPLGRRAQVVVLRAGDKGLVLGVTDASVRVLTETALAAGRERPIEIDPVATTLALAGPVGQVTSGTASPGRAVALPGTWRGLVEGLRERTVRRS